MKKENYRRISHNEFLEYIDKICKDLELELTHPDDLEDNIFF